MTTPLFSLLESEVHNENPSAIAVMNRMKKDELTTFIPSESDSHFLRHYAQAVISQALQHYMEEGRMHVDDDMLMSSLDENIRIHLNEVESDVESLQDAINTIKDLGLIEWDTQRNIDEMLNSFAVFSTVSNHKA